MRDAIITRMETANAPMAMTARPIGPTEEGFLALAGGGLMTLLPGDAVPDAPGARLIALNARATCAGAAGVGGIPQPDGGALGGWVRFRCALLCPRRFVARHLEALLDGQDPERLLTLRMRDALKAGFAACGGSRAALWSECRRRAADALMDEGWRLTGFKPMHLEQPPGR